MEKEYKEITATLTKKICTWKGCSEISKHQEPGSLMALCDKHNEEMDNSIKDLFK